jgi:hydrogenase expression/formation protein HypC
MCLAIPARVTKLLDQDMAKVEVGGIVKTVSLCLVDGVAVGDYIILHVGFALSKLEPEEARQTLALFAEAGVLEGLAEELAGEAPR